MRTTPALLPISIMPRNRPAILPSQPERPNTRYAAAISPAMFNPDTLPPPRFRKKPLSMLNNPPPEASRRKFDTPPVQFRVRASHSLAYGRDRLSGFVFQFLHVFGRTCKGIRGGFADYGLTDDPCDTFVGGQFFPAHIADGSSGSGHFDRLPGSPKGLRGMQYRMTGTFSRRIGGLAHAFHGLSAVFQYRIPSSHIFILF